MNDTNDDKTGEILMVQEDSPDIPQPETRGGGSESAEASAGEALPADVQPMPDVASDPDATPSDSSAREVPLLTAADVTEIVSGEVAKVTAALEALKASFDGKLRYDAKKDAIIDRQHEELMGYRNGLVDRVTLQVVGDLIGEIDSAEKLLKYYETAEPNEANYRKLLKVLKDFPLSLCDVLEKHGVYAYRSSAGSAFDPRRQQVLRSTETGDKSLDKTVRESVRSGYEREVESPAGEGPRMKAVRQEMVDVYLYKPELGGNKSAASASVEGGPAAEDPAAAAPSSSEDAPAT